MRKLDFEQFGDSDRRQRMFSILWMAFRVTYPKQAAGYENMKLCNRLGALLEKVSTESPSPSDALERKLTADVLLLPGTEHAKLLAMLKSEEVGWTHVIGPDVERLVDAMEGAPTVGEDGEEKKTGGKKKR